MSFAGMLFNVIINAIIFLVLKGSHGNVWGMSKNVWVLWVCFLIFKSMQAKKCTRWPYFTLLMICFTQGFPLLISLPLFEDMFQTFLMNNCVINFFFNEQNFYVMKYCLLHWKNPLNNFVDTHQKNHQILIIKIFL